MTTFVVMNSPYAHIVPLMAHLADNLSNVFSREVVCEACEANPWFSAADIDYAIGAIREQFLESGKLTEWLNGHPSIPVAVPRKVGVIAAGNIPLAGFFDLLCVLAAGHRCFIKPSSKDEVLMMALCRFLRSCGAPIELLHSEQKPDALIASGSDTTISAIAHSWSNTPSLLRGHRSSIAVLNSNESEDELRGLGNDLFRYNSMGCRNATLLWIPEGYNVEQLVLTLQTAREIVSPKYVGNYRQAKATAILTGESVVDGGFFTLQHTTTFPTRLAQVNLATYHTTDEVGQWLAHNDSHIQCVVCSSTSTLRHPRITHFGKAQRPTLYDWPDGIDTLNFLNNI